MVRRSVPLTLLAALALAGCEYGTEARLTAEQQRARVAFIEANDDYSDRDLARLCPGLYPRDFLTDEDEWPAGEARRGDLTSRQIEAARARQAAEIRAAACDVFPG